MSLPMPSLDSRTFAQLVSESVAQINRLDPDWTDYNASDPGITLIEVLAWLAEQNLYAADRVTPEMRRAFLRLVGVGPRPPMAAASVVALDTSDAVATVLPDRVQITDALTATIFETREPITVSPARLVRLMAGDMALEDVTEANRQPFDPVPNDRLGTFQPFGAAPGAALYLGFDRPLGTPGEPVSLHVWTRSPVADLSTAAALAAEWEREQAAATRDCPPGTALADWRQHYSARVVWEFFAGGTEWRRLMGVEDATRALTLTGFVRFPVPSGHVAGGPAPAWFLRCRLAAGGFDCPPWLDRIAVNAVTVEHAASVDRPEPLGTSRGHAGERYATALAPVVPGSAHLALLSGAERDESWSEAPFWDLIGPHDHRFLLEPERGGVVGANGLHGAVFPAGWQLVLDYRVGSGPAGNIPAGQLSRLAATGWNQARIPGLAAVAARIGVAQPYPAAGGTAAETLPAAETRALAELASPSVAVTLADLVMLARATPGVPVGRAKAVPNRHPAVPCFGAPGSITLIVVPDCPGPAPVPDLLAAVARYLRSRRPITAEVHVIGPRYIPVTVTASLSANSHADPDTIAAQAQRALDAFFAPLTGGPDGDGWPIGRSVYRAEVMTILAGLPGVLTVSRLGLAADGGLPTCDNLALCAGDLVQSMRHVIEVELAGATIFRRSKERECS